MLFCNGLNYTIKASPTISQGRRSGDHCMVIKNTSYENETNSSSKKFTQDILYINRYVYSSLFI
jgi:hypothetical protein